MKTRKLYPSCSYVLSYAMYQVRTPPRNPTLWETADPFCFSLSLPSLCFLRSLVYFLLQSKQVTTLTALLHSPSNSTTVSEMQSDTHKIQEKKRKKKQKEKKKEKKNYKKTRGNYVRNDIINDVIGACWGEGRAPFYLLSRTSVCGVCSNEEEGKGDR